jgi:uncharacterized protein (TIGR02757 family)
MKKLTSSELKDFLDLKVEHFEKPDFISDDPIQVPHRFSKKEDIEISAFLTALIAWGQRKTIIRNAESLMERMDHQPHAFLMGMSKGEEEGFHNFVHRTFNGIDCCFFIQRLSKLYKKEGGLEGTLAILVAEQGTAAGLSAFKDLFFQGSPPARSKKHLADPLAGSSAKRLNMFLRWMVRDASKGVDFGLWKGVSPSQLSMPLDVHTGNVGRSLSILKHKQNNWKAVAELDASLRRMDPLDPVKYDFALYGLGVHEGWK